MKKLRTKGAIKLLGANLIFGAKDYAVSVDMTGKISIFATREKAPPAELTFEAKAAQMTTTKN